MNTENWKRKLRCGDILTLRNGDKLFYLGYGDFDDGTTTDDYNENLQFINSFGMPIDSNFDIILIERPIKFLTVYKAKKQITKKEIEEILGYEIEIIEG